MRKVEDLLSEPEDEAGRFLQRSGLANRDKIDIHRVRGGDSGIDPKGGRNNRTIVPANSASRKTPRDETRPEYYKKLFDKALAARFARLAAVEGVAPDGLLTSIARRALGQLDEQTPLPTTTEESKELRVGLLPDQYAKVVDASLLSGLRKPSKWVAQACVRTVASGNFEGLEAHFISPGRPARGTPAVKRKFFSVSLPANVHAEMSRQAARFETSVASLCTAIAAKRVDGLRP